MVYRETQYKIMLNKKVQGIKHDSSKLRLDLIPPEAIEALGNVLTFGAKKYGDRNWQNGIAVSRLIASLLRHTLKFMKGQKVDEESGLAEIDHMICNCAMLKWMITHRPDLDDRKKQ